MSDQRSILEESKKSRLLSGLFRRWSVAKILGLVAMVATVLAVSWFFFLRGGEKNISVQAKQETWTVKRDDVRVAIEADGKVVADDMVALSYPLTGVTLQKVFVTQGQSVVRGDILATMDTGANQFDLRSAQNSYDSAVANLALKQAGPTSDQIESSLASIEQAKVSYEQAKISYEQIKLTTEQSVANAQRNVETAGNNLSLNKDKSTSTIVQNAYENLFNTLVSLSLTISNALDKSDDILGVDNGATAIPNEAYLGALNSGAVYTAENSFRIAKIQKDNLDHVMLGLSSGSEHSAIEAAAEATEKALYSMQDHYIDLQRALDYSITAPDFSQSQLDSLKSSVSSMRSSITGGLSSVANGQQSLITAENSLSNYQINYAKAVDDLATAKIKAEQDVANSEANLRAREVSLKQAQISYEALMAPPREVDLAGARIQVEQARINMDKVLYNIDQATLYAPIDGEVVEINGKEGDLISKEEAGDFIKILNKGSMFIEVNIEEADINKIRVGQKAYVTFDAIEDATVEGEVSFVSVISNQSANGITSYLVRVLLHQEGTEGLREGMTAFVSFAIAESPDVLVAPVSAVKNHQGKPAVQMEDGAWRTVVTGFTDGKLVEIMDGLKAGDRIIYTL